MTNTPYTNESGGVTFTVYNPSDDVDATMLINITHEGLIIDIYDEDGVQLLKTWCATADEMAESFFVGGDSTISLFDPADHTKGD